MADAPPRPALLGGGLGVMSPPEDSHDDGRIESGDLSAWLERVVVPPVEPTSPGRTLLVLDDAQRVRGPAIEALRSLPSRLAGCPVGLIAARCTVGSDPLVDRMFGEWAGLGAAAISLGPLSEAAVTDLVADALSAQPDGDLLAFVDGAAGNPLLVTELAEGMLEEGGITITGKRARLLSGRMPRRVQELIQDWVMQLPPESRHLLDVAATLDNSFGVGDLSRLLGRPLEKLEPRVRDLVGAGLFDSIGEDVLAFRHEMIRRWAADKVPAAVRGVLSSSDHDRLATTGGGPRPNGRRTRNVVTHETVRRSEEPVRPRHGAWQQVWDELTVHERTVAEMVARGLTNREVAERIYVSPHTVSFHLRKVYRKLDVRSRVELTRLCMEHERAGSHPDLAQSSN
ncbi:MAG: LuxR C-terminal-related transcriptional regulator [Nocardioidaceae bacterium]